MTDCHTPIKMWTLKIVGTPAPPPCVHVTMISWLHTYTIISVKLWYLKWKKT